MVIKTDSYAAVGQGTSSKHAFNFVFFVSNPSYNRLCRTAFLNVVLNDQAMCSDQVCLMLMVMQHLKRLNLC